MRLRCNRVLLVGVLTLLVSTLAPIRGSSLAEPTPASAMGGTTIVVDSTLDLATGISFNDETCTYTQAALYAPAPDGICTLRRAVLEASARPLADRPIMIEFNIPKADPNYDSSLDLWEVQIDESYVWMLEGGQITIDGSSQPGGRTDGPKIMINNNRDNLATFGRSLDVLDSGNTIQDVGFHGGGLLVLDGPGNVVENIWMGLSNDGLEMKLASTASTQAMRSMARGGILLPSANSDNNKILNNIIIGTQSPAIEISAGGDDNQLIGNWVGMNAQAEVAISSTYISCTRDLDYDPSLWYGGDGIEVFGDDNLIADNYLAGLHYTQSLSALPPTAIAVHGTNNDIADNVVGRDRNGSRVGVCGQGIVVGGDQVTVTRNDVLFSRNGFSSATIGSELDTAILVDEFDPLTATPWIEVWNNTISGLDQSEASYYATRFDGPGVASPMINFVPAKVTEIAGTTVSGTNGDTLGGGSSQPCPNCTIYLYLDDLDDRVEALGLLGTATADANGDWTTTISQSLSSGQSLRTQSRANADGLMHTYGAKTTSRLSDDLYAPSLFTALSEPCPIYDSRTAFGGLGGLFDGGDLRTIQVSGSFLSTQGVSNASPCIPDTATAAMLTISAVATQDGGNLRLSEAGVTPNGGVVNFADNGLNNANTVTVALSSDGEADVFANGGPTGVGNPLTHVRMAIVGYYSPESLLRYTPLVPCAAADSRTGTGGFAGPFAPNAAYPDIDVSGTFSASQGGGNTDCGVPASADAVVANLVAVNATGNSGALQAGTGGSNPSEPSTPFAPIGMNNSAAIVVPLDASGTVAVDVSGSIGAQTHIRLVVLGYLDSPGGSNYTPVNSCAVFDTRSSQGGVGVLQQGGSTTDYQIAGAIPAAQGGLNGGDCDVPAGATGVLINLVATNSAGDGNLQAFATGTSPTGGVLNFASLTPAMNNSNAVPIPLSASGQLSVFVNGGPAGLGQPLTHIRGVILGYYS